MSVNTLASDINEIHTAFVLAGNKWFDQDAKSQYEQRIRQVTPDVIADAMGKADVMAAEFIDWAKANGYKLPIVRVWWTARPGSLTTAVGTQVDQKKNPTDVLVKFSGGPNNGFLGLSAKASKSKPDIGFKNPGLGTLDKNLGMSLSAEYKNQLDQLIKKFKLPENADQRKAYIRANIGIKKVTEDIGVRILAAMRDEAFAKMQKMQQTALLKYLMQDWMDADILYPPYVKVTSQGSKPPYKATVMDPTDNEKLKALSRSKITLQKIGNESIGVTAGTKKIMKIRFKFESEKMASSVKLSGDPW